MKKDNDLDDISKEDWVEKYLSPKVSPYIRLCRLDRPIGIWLTLFPCLAALVQSSNYFPSISRILTFTMGAVLMRGIGCTINDIFDRKFDCNVERTRFRPIASQKINVKQALFFLFLQLALAFPLIFFINSLSKILAIFLLPIVFSYPLFKRFTYWPQFILGIAFNWGILMAWADTTDNLPLISIFMWLGSLFWQIGYDTIYAYIDIKDDKKLGLHSTALKFNQNGKYYVATFYFLSIAFWSVGLFLTDSSIFYTFGLLIISCHFLWQIREFQVFNAKKNLKVFQSNFWIGLILLLSVTTDRLF